MRGLLTVSAAAGAARTTEAFDPDRGWRLHPQVSVRPESFGALLYHFGTRKLSFLKNLTMVALVNSLAEHPDARSACRAAGIDAAAEPAYLRALGVLASSDILIAADPKETS